MAVIGLLAVAAGHNRDLRHIERAIHDVLGMEFEEASHVADTVYGIEDAGKAAQDADTLLDRLEAKAQRQRRES